MTRAPVIKCDCCNTRLPSYESEIYPGERYVPMAHKGVGVYCEPCWLALDNWTGGRGLVTYGLPQRCPSHLNPGRLAEINEHNLHALEIERQSR